MAKGRRPATPESDDRVSRVVGLLAAKKEEKNWSVQELSDRSGVCYETVRTLLASPKKGKHRQSPSFFVVIDVAHELGVSVNKLAQESRQ
jgi:transcriptional regulator with XRE-family HTH domain